LDNQKGGEKMKKRLFSLSLIVVIFLNASPLFAASPWTQEATLRERRLGKFAFGMKNTVFGWMDVIYEPSYYHRQGKSPIVGFGKGLADGVINTVGGVLQVATFPLPALDIPLPDNGVPPAF
jgi:hypothetical protein